VPHQSVVPPGVLQIRAQYDGTLWEVIAKEVEEREARKRGDEPKALAASREAQVRAEVGR
jgi:hypothetical protein